MTDEGNVPDGRGVVDLHRPDPPSTWKGESYRRASEAARWAARLSGHAIRGYSYRRASIGSRREALNAGYMPKNRPTAAENPRPIAKDHHGSETGKPEMRWTSR